MRTVGTVVILFVVALLFPELGKKEGILHSEFLTKIGVWIIFGGMGLSLKKEKWVEGIRSRSILTHIFIYHFLVGPLIGWGLISFFPSLPFSIKFAFFFLMALPTTISTSTVFSQKAGENPAVASIASVISNLLAVFLTPLWIGIYLNRGYLSDLPYWVLLKPILILVILPTFLGFLLRSWGGVFLENHSRIISKLNIGIVFFILYAAFCDSISSLSGKELEIGVLMHLAAMTIFVLILNHFLLWKFGSRFHPTLRYTFVFSGGQKSIATGAPIALAISAQSIGFLGPEMNEGVLLLPFILYHPAQIVLGALLLRRREKQD